MDEHLNQSNLTQANLAQAVLGALAEGVVVLDTAGRIVYINPGAARILGVEPAAGTGARLDDLILFPSGRTGVLETLRGAPGIRQLEVVVNGRETILSVSCTPLEARSEGTLVLAFRDLTEAESTQRLRSYFMANVSHEFRTPLAALSASVELLLEDIYHLPREEIVSLLQSIHYSVTGLQTLIDNLLESVSIEAGRFKVRLGPASVRELVGQAAQVMKPLLNRRGQELRVDTPTPDPVAQVDFTRLTQVLVNLLSNASKYSPMHTPIQLTARTEAGWLHISVADQGPGLSPADRLMVFRRFVRLSDSSGAQYGAGLGLAVVKAIVEAHQGRVGVEENPGGGALFWFEIPLAGTEA